MAGEIIALIQARMGSSRLPGKVLLPLCGETVLRQVVSRVSAAKSVDEAIVVTTIEKGDLPIVKACADMGIRVFCGSEEDVLDRYYQISRLLKPKSIIRITADCPLMDPEIIDKVVMRHQDCNSDYTSNAITETFPDGLDVEVVDYQALEKAWNLSKQLSEREHVTLFIRNHPELFKIESVDNFENTGNYRWTLDEQRDYEFIMKVYEYFYPVVDFGYKDIFKLLKKDPELEKINQNIVRNEGLQKSLQKEKNM